MNHELPGRVESVREAGAVGQQVDVGQSVQPLQPVFDHLTPVLVLDALPLPLHVILILRRQWREFRRPSRNARLIKVCELASQQKIRPAIEDDVVNGNVEYVLAAPQRRQRRQQQRPASQIEHPVDLRRDDAFQEVLPIFRRHARLIDHGKLDRRV